MGNAVPSYAKQQMITPLLTKPLKAALVRGYTPAAGHKFVSDVTGAGGSLVATTPVLTSMTVLNGVFDADDYTFSSVATGTACAHLIVFEDTGTPSTSVLWAVLDTGTGFPFTPNGGPLTIQWAAGGIFQV